MSELIPISRIFGIALLLLQFSGGMANAYASTPDFATLLREPENSSQEIRATLQSKKIVFVAGVLNELAPSYFSDSIGVLRKAYGVEDSILISPASFSSIAENGKILAERFKEFYQESGHPLIVIAHSKGAAETLLALLYHPELIEKGIVEKVIAVQGAFNGSPVADLLNGGGHLEPWADFLNKHIPGLRNLGTDSAKAVFADALAKVSAQEREALSARVSYIRTSQKAGRTVFYMAGCSLYLATLKLPNDGVLITDDQRLGGIGSDIGLIDKTDHTDFVVPFPYSSKRSKVRKAFTHALVKVIAE